jgi:hypothetical protein
MLPFSIEEIVGTTTRGRPNAFERRHVKTMNATKNPTPFQQIFAAFCVFIADLCIFLFFLASASKFRQLLIRTICYFTNQLQREFHSNVAIATQKLFSYSALFAKLTNLFKPWRVYSPLSLAGEDGRGLIRAAEQRVGAELTNLSKRTLIQMSLYGHLSTSHPRQQTNLSKPFLSKTMKAFVGAHRCVRPKIAEILKFFSLIYFCGELFLLFASGFTEKKNLYALFLAKVAV